MSKIFHNHNGTCMAWLCKLSALLVLGNILIAHQSLAQEVSSASRAIASANGEFLLLRDDLPSAGGPAAGNAGGASMADFGQLMNLIQTTVDPDLWESGDASLMPYPGGIFLDTEGVVRRVKLKPHLVDSVDLGELPKHSAKSPRTPLGWQATSGRRFISVRGLLTAASEKQEAGLAFDSEMMTLAGLHRIDFVVVDNHHRDILLVGPAGGTIQQRDGYTIMQNTNQPPLSLSDFLAIAKSFALSQNPTLLCTLDPTREGLARVHSLLQQPGAAARLVRDPQKGSRELSDTLGGHQVSLSGIEPTSPTALALLEADIHMKRLGLGLEKGGAELQSYPQWAQQLSQQPSGQLLRWWFTPAYPEILTNAERTVFALPAERVQLESEQQKMDAAGNRRAEVAEDKAARAFAKQFTDNFSKIQQQYPIYTRLSHIFDIAVACKLAVENSQWELNSLWSQSELAPVAITLARQPREVESTTAAGTWTKGEQVYRWLVVSGGVELDMKRFVTGSRLRSSPDNKASQVTITTAPKNKNAYYWWWD